MPALWRTQDKTFTCTLFAPTSEFATLSSPEIILRWFKTHFPDALPLIGEEALLADFQRNPKNPLISIKAKPYHYRDRVIILGDAAHSMVPFYGQGLNCGLEDVRVLDHLLRSHKVDPTTSSLPEGEVDGRLAAALRQYSEERHEDLITICDLAMDNYTEMRHSVTTPAYLLRKAVDNVLYALTLRPVTSVSLSSDGGHDAFPTPSPSGWLPQYTMVTFRPDISYATVRRKVRKQEQVLSYAGWVSGVMVVCSIGIACVGVVRRFRR